MTIHGSLGFANSIRGFSALSVVGSIMQMVYSTMAICRGFDNADSSILGLRQTSVEILLGPSHALDENFWFIRAY